MSTRPVFISSRTPIKRATSSARSGASFRRKNSDACGLSSSRAHISIIFSSTETTLCFIRGLTSSVAFLSDCATLSRRTTAPSARMSMSVDRFIGRPFSGGTSSVPFVYLSEYFS